MDFGRAFFVDVCIYRCHIIHLWRCVSLESRVIEAIVAAHWNQIIKILDIFFVY